MTPKEKRLLTALKSGTVYVFGPIVQSSFFKDGEDDIIEVYHELYSKYSFWMSGYNYYMMKDLRSLFDKGYITEEFCHFKSGKLCITDVGLAQLKKTKTGGTKTHRDRILRQDRNVKGQRPGSIGDYMYMSLLDNIRTTLQENECSEDNILFVSSNEKKCSWTTFCKYASKIYMFQDVPYGCRKLRIHMADGSWLECSVNWTTYSFFHRKPTDNTTLTKYLTGRDILQMRKTY